MPTHVFTSIAANYLPKARVLARSVKQFHPDVVFHLVLCDAVPASFDLDQEPFDSLLTLSELVPQNSQRWAFQHSMIETTTGVKGFALVRILELPSCSEVLYFDPDILVMAPIEGLLERFKEASVLLTPHLSEPEETIDAILDNELSALRHGVFNLGFLGVKNSEEGLRFARWWAARLDKFCYDDIPAGLFTDQRWIDLAPAYFSDLAILREPVYNVATWNLTHRHVGGSLERGVTVNGQALIFYHFSGFDSGAQETMLKKYGADMPVLFELRSWYISECKRMGQQACSLLPWAYGCYDNGELITAEQRKLYRTRQDLQEAFANPYSTADSEHSYLDWYRANIENRPNRSRPAAP